MRRVTNNIWSIRPNKLLNPLRGYRTIRAAIPAHSKIPVTARTTRALGDTPLADSGTVPTTADGASASISNKFNRLGAGTAAIEADLPTEDSDRFEANKELYALFSLFAAWTFFILAETFDPYRDSEDHMHTPIFVATCAAVILGPECYPGFSAFVTSTATIHNLFCLIKPLGNKGRMELDEYHSRKKNSL